MSLKKPIGFVITIFTSYLLEKLTRIINKCLDLESFI